ncbi:MAG: hypothetical protein RMK21_07525 [Aquificaceae bacterium]|nr:hypothetical protein [Aquificaceae bacterium]
MESGRRGPSLRKPEMKRGVALISVLVTSVIVALILGGLYLLLTRVFEAHRISGIYATTSDAAKGGVNYALSQILGGNLETLSWGACPDGTNAQAGNCCNISIRYRLLGVSGEYPNNIRICLSAYVPTPGDAIGAVADPTLGTGGRGFIYTIVSETLGPQGSKARVEAVYAR